MNRGSFQSQGEFNFDDHQSDGYARWLAARTLAVEEVARQLHLPLGQQVEVWLAGGIRLRGKLTLQQEFLVLEEGRARHLGLMVDHVAFAYRELESCVRLEPHEP